MNLKELSSLLGLSQTTVSRALNGYPEVSEKTRARVIKAAQAHAYSPNTRAQGLATGHSKCIGHVISVSDSAEMVNPIFGDFMAGAGETYSAHGYDMMVTRVGAEAEADTYRNLKARGAVDGIVVHAPRRNDSRMALLDKIGLPYVVHGRSTGITSPYSWLDVNNTRAFSEATSYLVGLGHKRIALINGQETMDFAIRRRSGYESSLRFAGLPIDMALMTTGEMTEAYGYSEAMAMLALDTPPTAFLVASIICAAGIRRALDEKGLRAGKDVSIVTFDDCLSYFANGDDKPVFTAWQSSVREAGARVAQMLIDRIRAPIAPHETELWEAAFVEGTSTGPAPSKD
ncbi:substrate-binding domain-containing protein [Tateyamaria omphalii]|uniref:LacI family DNA-binding transcriptional regulator n=1 Tax=Tateyamaria omphalii TaxID=299262 RepID=UPI001C9A0CD8|nr:substrate-binding domain-containing protein [Tateyamaria omphalii]MBY5935270.1 substrate-binding domain-containing protein [Tateyamaria omphalii]